MIFQSTRTSAYARFSIIGKVVLCTYPRLSASKLCQLLRACKVCEEYVVELRAKEKSKKQVSSFPHCCISLASTCLLVCALRSLRFAVGFFNLALYYTM